MNMEQRSLSTAQVRAFHHPDFVPDQVRDFARLAPLDGPIVDVGGGCGHFARALAERFPALRPKVIDIDEISLALCAARGIDAELGNALTYAPEDGVLGCFNLVLHHLVGKTDRATRCLQVQALQNWGHQSVFVNEYVYDGLFAGRLIFAVTSSARLCRIARLFSLEANTCGTGVRFRSRCAWESVFGEAGFCVTGYLRGTDEDIHRLLRPFVRSIRRDSFILAPAKRMRSSRHCRA